MYFAHISVENLQYLYERAWGDFFFKEEQQQTFFF